MRCKETMHLVLQFLYNVSLVLFRRAKRASRERTSEGQTSNMTQKVATERKMKLRQEATSLSRLTKKFKRCAHGSVTHCRNQY